MQHGGAVLVQHALGVAGGAGGIAEAGSRLLVELRPFELGGLRSQQILVAVHVLQRRLGHVIAVRHDDETLHALQFGLHLLQQRHEGQVDKDELILGMVRDVDDLLREQARVDRVQHRTEAGDAVVAFQVAVGVPGQGSDSVTQLHAQPGEGVGKLFRALVGIRIGVAMDRAFDGAGHDFRPPVIGGGIVDQRVDQKLLFLHQPEHRFILP